MAVLKIRTVGEDALRKKCKEVHGISPRTIQLIDDMFETMYAAGGVGLAAPQVGIVKRIVVIDVSPEEEEKKDGDASPDEEKEIFKFAMINPKILSQEGEDTDFEGCLSYPGMCGKVKRPTRITVSYFGTDGNEYEMEAEGFLARCICHELDHLDGILYQDKTEGPVLTNEERREQLMKEMKEEK